MHIGSNTKTSNRNNEPAQNKPADNETNSGLCIIITIHPQEDSHQDNNHIVTEACALITVAGLIWFFLKKSFAKPVFQQIPTGEVWPTVFTFKSVSKLGSLARQLSVSIALFFWLLCWAQWARSIFFFYVRRWFWNMRKDTLGEADRLSVWVLFHFLFILKLYVFVDGICSFFFGFNT